MEYTGQKSAAGPLEHEDLHGASPAVAFACQTESLAELAHDARNMAAVLDLYCDLLQEPGVLAPPFAHYGGELKHVAATSRALVERLAALNTADSALTDPKRHSDPIRTPKFLQYIEHSKSAPVRPIENMAAEVLSSRNFLSALAGPTISLGIDVEECALPVELAGEDLTRILVNLVKNAAEAMRSGGRIHISLRESARDFDRSSWLILNVEDNGPGFPDSVLSSIPERGKDAASLKAARGEGHTRQRRLGLSIVRSLVDAAGGRIHAANQDPVGACVQIELPVRQLCAANSSLKITGDNASFN